MSDKHEEISRIMAQVAEQSAAGFPWLDGAHL